MQQHHMLFNETATAIIALKSSNGGPVHTPVTDVRYESLDPKIFTIARDPNSTDPNAIVITGVAVGSAILRAWATSTQQRGMSVKTFETDAEIVLLKDPPVPGHPLVPERRGDGGPATSMEFSFGRPTGSTADRRRTVDQDPVLDYRESGIRDEERYPYQRVRAVD